MIRMIFINLPVANLSASMAFYQALGFENNPQFTDDTAACMVWSDAIHVMLLTHDKWRFFTNRPIAPPDSSEVMLALSLASREAVDSMNSTAAENGGTRYTAIARHWTAAGRQKHLEMGFIDGWSMVADQLAELAERTKPQ